MAQVQTEIPRVGDKAPDFTLPDTDRQSVSLSDFQGRTLILVFFPAAFSSVCTAELCTFRDSMARLNQAHAIVLGISVDLPWSLKEFKKAQGLEFPLLSDYDRTVIARYGVADYNFNGFSSGVARRSVFVIDPTGTIRWQWLADKPSEQPDYGAVLQAAQETAG